MAWACDLLALKDMVYVTAEDIKWLFMVDES